MVPIAYIYKSEIHYTGIKCTPMFGRKRRAEWRVVRTHQYSWLHAGIICFQTRGHKGGKKEYKTARRCGKGGVGWELVMTCVCLCMCVHLVRWVCFYLSLCTVLMWITILALPLYAFWLELDTRDKRLHICACMSRITCSIECVPLLSAYHSLYSLISFLSLLNGFLSLSPHHKCSLSPLLFFNTYKTEKAWRSLGHLEAPVKLSPRPGSLPLASCSIVSGPSQLIPCIAIVAGHCLQPPPTPPG